MNTRIPAIIAWLCFTPGVILITASIVRLRIDGITITGAVLLALWAWLIGALTREFWTVPLYPEGHPNNLSQLDLLDGVGSYTAAKRHLEPTSHLGPLFGVTQKDIDRAASRLDGAGTRKDQP